MTEAARIKLPREIEADPKFHAIEAALSRNQTRLWEGGQIQVSRLPLTEALEEAFTQALHFKKLERGLEQAETILRKEKKGIEAMQAKQGAAPARRASRLLFVTNDGAERFYRSCETLLLQQQDRVLGFLLDVDSATLGLKLFGPEKPVKALLVSDRDAVTLVLRALV